MIIVTCRIYPKDIGLPNKEESFIFDNYSYIEISPRREKALDYLDHEDGYVMDWNKEEDKIALVKNIGVYCLDPDKDECEECCAKEWCSKYEEYEEEE